MKHWIETALFVAAVGSFSAIMAGPANADPRIEVNADNSFCHILHGNVNNSDDETFDGACVPFVAANGAGSANGWGRSERRGVSPDVIPHVFTYGEKEAVGRCRPGHAKKRKCKTEWTVDVTQDDYPGLLCTIVETNGTQYYAQNWRNRITYSAGVLVNDLKCLNGQ